MFSQIEQALVAWAQEVPLVWFAFIGSFIEEVIAPIPSPLVMTVTGSLLQAQNKSWFWFFLIALIAAVGKTIGSWIIYFVSDKAEDIIVGKFGHFFGISHKEVEHIGTYFTGGFRDYLVITLARAIPVMPTSAVSITCGAIKLPLKTYLSGTMVGTLFRNMFYLWLGMMGVQSLNSILNGLDTVESIIQVIFAGIAATLIAYLYYKRNRGTDMFGLVKRMFAKKRQP